MGWSHADLLWTKEKDAEIVLLHVLHLEDPRGCKIGLTIGFAFCSMVHVYLWGFSWEAPENPVSLKKRNDALRLGGVLDHRCLFVSVYGGCTGRTTTRPGVP